MIFLELDNFKDVNLVIDKANDTFIQKQFVSSGDVDGRTLTVQLTNGGEIGASKNTQMNLRWNNLANGITDLSAFELIDASKSIFRIEYPQNMLTPGDVKANIQIIQDEKVTHLRTFTITVQRLAGNDKGFVENAQYSALVRTLSDANKFRTDIDTLAESKADWEDLNRTDANLDALDQKKADKTSLSTTNATVASLASNKVDKGGNEQITLPMLSQEVKESMTGGSVAVVGTGGVNTTNLADKSVTPIKLATSGYQVMLSGSVVARYDSVANTLEIPSGIQAMQQAASSNGVGVAVNASVISSTPNAGWLVYDTADKLIKLNNTPTSTQSKCGYIWKNHVDGPKCVLFGIDVYVDGFKQQTSDLDNLKNGNYYVLPIGGKFIWNKFENRLYYPQKIHLNNGYKEIKLSIVEAADYTQSLPEYIDLSASAGWIIFNHKAGTFRIGTLPGKNEMIFGYWQRDTNTLAINCAPSLIAIKTSKAAFLGDSITEGVNTTKTYWQYIDDDVASGVNAVGYGVGGTTVAVQSTRTDSFLERKDTVSEDSNVIVIFGGTNDYGASNALGAIDDGLDNTFLGAYSQLIDWYHVNRPNAKIICCTPLRRYYKGSTTVWKDAHTVENSQGLTLQDYAQAVRDVAREKCVPLVDLYFDSGLDPRLDNVRTQYMTDGLHPNAAGHQYFYKLIMRKIEEVMNK